MQTVYLNGEISKFGERWETSCTTLGDILRLIECQTPGFRQHLINSAEAGIDYQIMKGKDLIGEEDLFLTIGDEDIIITELPAGAGKAGKIIAGIALVITAVVLAAPTGGGSLLTLKGIGAAVANMGFFTGSMALIGVSLAMSGISEMMMPGPEVDGTEQNKNFLFQGPVNTMTQGMPIPIAYGELIVGGAPISVGFSNTPISISDPTYNRNTDNSATTNVTGGDTQNNTQNSDGSYNNNENNTDNSHETDYGCGAW